MKRGYRNKRGVLLSLVSLVSPDRVGTFGVPRKTFQFLTKNKNSTNESLYFILTQDKST